MNIRVNMGFALALINLVGGLACFPHWWSILNFAAVLFFAWAGMAEAKYDRENQKKT